MDETNHSRQRKSSMDKKVLRTLVVALVPLATTITNPGQSVSNGLPPHIAQLVGKPWTYDCPCPCCECALPTPPSRPGDLARRTYRPSLPHPVRSTDALPQDCSCLCCSCVSSRPLNKPPAATPPANIPSPRTPTS